MIWLLMTVLAQSDSPDFDAFFQEFAEKRAAVQTVQARFSQTNINPDESNQSFGSIVFANPRRLLFQYTDPKQGILFNENVLYDYYAEAEQLTVQRLEKGSEAEALFLAFENQPERLRELYDVAISPESDPGIVTDTCSGRLLVLLPKVAQQEERPFVRAQLVLREEDFLPCRIQIIWNENSESYVDITDIVVNGENAKSALQFTLPQGVSIIMNEQIMRVTENERTIVPDDVPLSAPSETASQSQEPSPVP